MFVQLIKTSKEGIKPFALLIQFLRPASAVASWVPIAHCGPARAGSELLHHWLAWASGVSSGDPATLGPGFLLGRRAWKKNWEGTCFDRAEQAPAVSQHLDGPWTQIRVQDPRGHWDIRERQLGLSLALPHYTWSLATQA